LRTWRFPYLCVCHWLGMPLGYHPSATVRQENPLIINLHYNITRLEKEHCSSCPPQVLEIFVK
jgi:hypothetical protein